MLYSIHGFDISVLLFKLLLNHARITQGKGAVLHVLIYGINLLRFLEVVNLLKR